VKVEFKNLLSRLHRQSGPGRIELGGVTIIDALSFPEITELIRVKMSGQTAAT